MKTNNIVKKALMLMLIGAMTFACKKKDTEPNPEEPATSVATATEFQNFMRQTFEGKIQKASFNAEDGYTFTSAKGVILTLLPNSLTFNGQLVTGQVDLEFSEFFGRGAMAVCNVTTIGLNANQEKDILTSGGTFHIKVYQNGNELASNSGMMLKVSASLTGGLDQQMKPFVGSIDQNNNLLWEESSIEFFTDNDGTYNAFLANFGWFNIDMFCGFNIPKGRIELFMPEGYSTQNAAVFVSIDSVPNSLSYLVTGEDFYPQSNNINLIFISVQNGQYVYAVKSITVQDINNVTFTNSDLQLTTEENLTQIVDNLP